MWGAASHGASCGPRRSTAWRGRARLTKDSVAPMTWLKAAIAPRDNDLETTLRASPLWREHDDLWQRAKGMGPVCARTVLLALPELGTRTRQHIAA